MSNITPGKNFRKSPFERELDKILDDIPMKTEQDKKIVALALECIIEQKGYYPFLQVGLNNRKQIDNKLNELEGMLLNTDFYDKEDVCINIFKKVVSSKVGSIKKEILEKYYEHPTYQEGDTVEKMEGFLQFGHLEDVANYLATAPLENFTENLMNREWVKELSADPRSQLIKKEKIKKDLEKEYKRLTHNQPNWQPSNNDEQLLFLICGRTVDLVLYLRKLNLFSLWELYNNPITIFYEEYSEEIPVDLIYSDREYVIENEMNLAILRVIYNPGTLKDDMVRVESFAKLEGIDQLIFKILTEVDVNFIRKDNIVNYLIGKWLTYKPSKDERDQICNHLQSLGENDNDRENIALWIDAIKYL